MKSHIYNTDFYSMESFGQVKSRNPTIPFAEAMLKHIDENEIVIGDPSQFDNEYDDFDRGWDLDEPIISFK